MAEFIHPGGRTDDSCTRGTAFLISVLCSSIFSLGCFVGSVGSVLSVASAFSIGSVGSSFSLLSIGSHQSILSIGCNNRFMTICNQQTYPGQPLVPSGGEVIIDKIDAARCGDDKTAVSLSTPGSTTDFLNYDLCSIDEEMPLTCPEGAPVGLTGPEACLDNDLVKKDQTLIVQRKDDNTVQSVASMPPLYEYNRAANYEFNYVEFQQATILITDRDEWQRLSGCTYEQKKADHDMCDWADATCIFDGLGEQACKVKRKGNGSWRDVKSKPSLKVKWKHRGGQSRLTFNNNVQEPTAHARVRAYATFRGIGVVAPRANSMMLRFGPSLAEVNAYQEYTQVEEIDEVEFLGARGLDGASVYELEYYDKHRPDQTHTDVGPTTHKLGPQAAADASLMDLQGVFAGTVELGEVWQIVNKSQMFKWYAGLLATGSWDSGCRASHFNNMYVLLPYMQQRYIFVPWGADRTMYCHARDWLMPSSFATCSPMQECFANAQCSSEYYAAMANTPKLCGTEHGYFLFNVLLLMVIGLAYFKITR